MTHHPLRIAVAVSGGGRTLQNLISRSEGRGYHVAAVLASKPDCPAITLAESAHIPVLSASFPREMTPMAQSDIERWLREQDVELIALAGFLRPFPILQSYADRIVNIHPSLLPAFGGQGMYGAKVHTAVWNARESYSGATVHFVSEHYDEGQILAQIRVPIAGLENPEAIAQRVFSAECKLYPEVLHRLATGKLPEGDKAFPIFEEDIP